MNVILTHEQADFDALASLLGAWLLDEESIPVLPRRTNRNCRLFLALYGSELPFVAPGDLPGDPINTITVVDTQSHVTLKGTGNQVSVRVIDHHSPRSDLPNNWQISFEKLGACTSIFVEQLEEKKLPLTHIQASLLLLGIYEDTGSLTYVSTTPRDVRAVAYLLEEGALLRIAGKYLNPPLSPEQWEVYNRLLKTIENLQIHGQKISIACTSANELTEEISSIAHKLRDMIDPDALFLLVNTTDGIRLIARATTDHIDVSAIAAHFGGGGHTRAAAALIHQIANIPIETQLQSVRQELIQILPKFIRPAITVGQIMSRRPMLISPQMSAKDAALLMQRYGYEGYPVIENSRVIGLLTRRAVDRALSHKLNLTAGSLMEANEVTIQPGDSIEKLQQLMIESGWGQIPVISPEDGEIIGIVTRTDLVRMVAGNGILQPVRENLADRLEITLPPARLALLKSIAEKSHLMKLPTYIVGGFLRDLLLDRPGFDFDVVVEGDAIALGKSMVSQFGGRIVAHSRFGTAKWWIADVRSEIAVKLGTTQKLSPDELPHSLDLISARTEFYEYPTALPTVERGSIKLDLHRRDFTINTLALRLDGRHYGELYDYWGGLNDLRRGLVRVLHSLSFVDDPTRMLRAVRFEQRFKFKIEQRTLQLIGEAKDLLCQVSNTRLRHEFDLMLAEENPEDMFSRLKELDLLSIIHPRLDWEDTITKPMRKVLFEPIPLKWKLPLELGHYPINQALAFLVWLIPQNIEIIKAASVRLRLPGVIHEALISAKKLLNDLAGFDNPQPSSMVERLDSTPRPALYAIYCLEIPDDFRKIIERYLNEWQYIHITTDGHTLQSLGVKPGPIYSKILSTLRAARLDGQIRSDAEEEALLHQMVRAFSTR